MPSTTEVQIRVIEGYLDTINERLTAKLKYQAEEHHILNITKAEGAGNELMELRSILLNELEVLQPSSPDQLELTHYFQHEGKDYAFVTEENSKSIWKNTEHYVVTSNTDKNATVVFEGNYEETYGYLDTLCKP